MAHEGVRKRASRDADAEPAPQVSKDTWQSFLTAELKCKVLVTYTRARQTPLQVRPSRTKTWRSGPEHLEVRMHSMFTDAPAEVHRAVVSWIRSGRRAPRACAVLDRWIATSLESLPKSAAREQALRPRGAHHDLDAMARELCARELASERFASGAAPGVTWGRRSQSRTRHSLRLGSFDPTIAVVRIHPVLDQPAVPDWFVRFVLFHELLHAVMPPKPGRGARWVHHSQAFRRRERIYPDYARAIAWEDKHMAKLIASARSGKPIPVLAPESAPVPAVSKATSKRHWLQQLLFPG